MTYIYKITNKINDKIYIGQTIQPINKRWIQHKVNARKKGLSTVSTIGSLYYDMNRYGFENFEISCLESCSADEINDREIYYIRKYNSLVPQGYNLSGGGKGITGYKFSKLGLKRLSESQKQRWSAMSKEEKVAWGSKISKALKGIKKSDEHKKKLSELAKTRIGEKNPFYGKSHTDKVKKHLREINLGNTFKQGVKVACEKEGFKKMFDSYSDASYWLIENGFTKSKNRTSVTTTIKESVVSGKKRYGFVWKKIE